MGECSHWYTTMYKEGNKKLSLSIISQGNSLNWRTLKEFKEISSIFSVFMT